MAMKKTTKKLAKADNGYIVKNKKVVSKNSFAGNSDDGISFKTKRKTVWDNVGTKENPIATNQRSKSKTTITDASGKNTTYVTKTNNEGETKKRKAIIPVRKKGGAVKSKNK